MSVDAILRILASEHCTTEELKYRLSGSMAKATSAGLIQRMAEDGLITGTTKHPVGKSTVWMLTEKGRLRAPRSERWMPAFTPYVPPVVQRRPGSDAAARLPSLFAGERKVPR